MKLVSVRDERSAQDFRKYSLIAVDLGFSSRHRTTGVAWTFASQSEPMKMQFGEAVAAVVGKCRTLSEVVLIIEAPLSAAFDALGNPRPRGNFECDPLQRWWSVGPGAATALSALFFLREIESQLNTSSVTIYLVEGFVSGNASGDHGLVAASLRDGFRGKLKCRWHAVSDEGDVVSALDWLECDSLKHPPVILQPVA